MDPSGNNPLITQFPQPEFVSIDELFQMLQGTRDQRACWLCRFWQEERDDQRQPRWGNCLRMAAQPPPLMFAVAEDSNMGATLMTHPKFWCAEFDGD